MNKLIIIYRLRHFVLKNILFQRLNRYYQQLIETKSFLLCIFEVWTTLLNKTVPEIL